MSTLPNPLTNLVNASLLTSSTEHRGRYEKIDDPQLRSLLDQKTQGRYGLDFHLYVLEKLADGAAQQYRSAQPADRIVEAHEAPDGPNDSPEMTWLVENRRTIEAYRGEWLLIFNDRLIVHSTDFGEIQRAINNERIRSPFVYYVPTVEESNFIAF